MSQPGIFEFVPEPCRVHPSTPLLCLFGCASHRLGCHGDHLPLGADVAEVLSLPIKALIAEKAFFLLKQKANCPVPAGANMKPVLFAVWEGSASRFVGEYAGTHIQLAD